MMWWLVSSVYEITCYSMLDFVYFLLIDGVAKSLLKEARSEKEKKTIWLFESLVLAVVCLLIHTFEHCPYFLIILTVITAVYTQFCRQVDFRNWWQRFVEHWEVHVHLADNVKAINEKRKQIEIWRKLSTQAPVSKRVMSRLSDFICRRNETRNQIQPTQTPTSVFSKIKAPIFWVVNLFRNLIWTSAETPNNQSVSTVPQSGQPYPQPMQSFPQPGQAIPRPTQAFSQPPSFRQSNPVYMQPSQDKLQFRHNFPQKGNVQASQQTFQTSQYSQTPVQQVNNWFTSNQLKRRPLRNYEQRNISSLSSSSTRTSMRDKFMSAIGMSTKSMDLNKPPGFRNEKLNLCFLNCVIQCLSHTPKLVDKLKDAKNDLDCSEVETDMINELVDLMSRCKRTKRDSADGGVLDPTVLREAISALNTNLVVPPGERQRQQDAGEFFMWLTEKMHHILNKKTVKEGGRPKGSGLDTLEFIYKDISEDRIQELKKACRQEINQANGLQNETYAEPIQRLSDLEWLTYKQRNHSVIDDMFTGQIVEANQCIPGYHLKVNMQTFTILPVPIETINNHSGIVPLQACFTKFCNVEHLIGSDGVECEMCMQRRNSMWRNSQVNSRLSSVDSGIHSNVLAATAMSPIPGQTEALNDSGYQDNVFRTSTPVGERTTVDRRRFTFPSRDDQYTERRCLLRQLPDCLVIQVLRFSYNQYTQQTDKIHTPISIPLKRLDLTNIVYDHVTNREDLTAGHREHRYDLYAVCSHLGAESTNYGHYVCYCLAENGQWYKFDDDIVTEINIEFEITSKEIRENAYILFYKRATERPS